MAPVLLNEHTRSQVHKYMCLNTFDLLCLFGFYGVSNVVGYSMPNPFL